MKDHEKMDEICGCQPRKSPKAKNKKKKALVFGPGIFIAAITALVIYHDYVHPQFEKDRT